MSPKVPGSEAPREVYDQDMQPVEKTTVEAEEAGEPVYHVRATDGEPVPANGEAQRAADAALTEAQALADGDSFRQAYEDAMLGKGD